MSSRDRVELADRRRLGEVACKALPVARVEAELQRVEVAAEAISGERLPACGVLADIVEVRAAVGERAGERVGDRDDGRGVLLGEATAHGPDRVDHRQAGPRLPLGAEVVVVQAVGLLPVGAQRVVADEQRGVGLAQHRGEVGRHLDVRGVGAPALLDEDAREHLRGARRVRERHGAAGELLGGDLGEEQDRLHLAVGGDRDVGEQHEVVGVARVLDGGNGRDVEAPSTRLTARSFGSALTRSTSSSTSFFTRP